ncbi:MAG: DUF1727 domain-containing protein [Clostridiaceae bacterium]|jgi:UDP-N-acetylmuramoyl-L-alanyl-D-glutamate--2,6-diaminopimelate ligase|nr:DUF1727 domain-containing protein [Clostridiaceae bacterium]
MKKFVYFITLLISKLQKLIGGGTSFPGKVALRLKPDLLSQFKLPATRIFVSGTNGKTSISNYLAAIFDQAGYSVCHNTAGANLKQGIVTTFINHANSKLEIKSDALVIEIDEITMIPVFSELDPSNLLLTNLFTDQIDRMGDKWQLARKLSRELPAGLNLYLNGDDPVLVWLAEQIKPQKVVYFGLDPATISQETNPQIEKCPYCDSELAYNVRYYESLGRFSCSCGFAAPKLDYVATEIDLFGQTFLLEDQLYQMPYAQLYLVYNMLAAAVFAKETGIADQLISNVLAKQESAVGRFEFLEFNEHEAWLNLVKNPAGINQALDYLKRELKIAEQNKQKTNLMLAFNNLPADGLDFSWLDQANFELLQSGSLAAIYLCGTLQKQVLELLVKKGISAEKILLVDDISESIAKMKTSNLPSYFLTNFTMLKSIRENILKA